MTSPLYSTIAIHGVGRHEPGAIERSLRTTIGAELDFELAVTEFNWDQFVDHRRTRSPRDAFDNLRRICGSFHATAVMALSVRREGLDTRLCNAQRTCCSLLRHLMVIAMTAVFAIPAIVIVVLLPTRLLQIAPMFPWSELRWIATAAIALILYPVTVLIAAILLLGLTRALAQRSSAPVRSAVTCVVLTCLSPVLAVLSAPLSVSWYLVGGLVGFFCLVGLLASVLEWLMPDVPAYTVWRDFAIAPYLLAIVGGLLVLQVLRILFARWWYEGPVKVLLDINRYVGEPPYRWRTLEQLNTIIRDAEKGSNNLVLVAHSLGSIIALDYLCNHTQPNRDRRVWLVTLGSPYRRFFRWWLPGVLFDQTTIQTVAAISARCHSFRWLNVFRPWDYIGKSLNLRSDKVGFDQSTGQLFRFNGHADYWSDVVVLKTIKSALSSIPELSGPDDLPCRRCVPMDVKFERSDKAPRYMRLALALGALSVAWMVYSFFDQQTTLAAIKTEIDRRGIRQQVLVAHREIPDVADELATAHEFAFIGEGFKMAPYQLSPVLSASVAQQRLDYRRLEQFVRSDCILERQPRWYETEKMLLCTSKQTIEIAYLPSASNGDFYLPGFESQFYYRDIPYWFIYPLVLLGFTLIPAIPFIMLTSALYAAFLGRHPGNVLMEINE